jgi:predicted Rdx family selenoprotein
MTDADLNEVTFDDIIASTNGRCFERAKTREKRCFERKLAAIARKASALSQQVIGLVAQARELGYADEQIGAVMMAVEAVLKAEARTRDAANVASTDR